MTTKRGRPKKSTENTTTAVIKSGEEEMQTTTDIAVSPNVQQLSIQELANNAVKSGMYKDIENAEQAVMKLICGRELGLSPLFSLQKLLIVNGQVTCMGEVIIYKWREQGYTWQRIFYNKNGEDIELPTTQDKNIYGCGIILWSPQGKLLTKDAEGNAKPCTFDMDRAAIAGLTGKDNWKKYPDRLLFYRAVAFCARDYTPGITGGMTTTEEMQDVVELQKANVKQISTGGGVETSKYVNTEAPVCPKHNVPFTMNKWGKWSHPTDEKNAEGKTIWCSKDKIEKELKPEQSEPQGDTVVVELTANVAKNTTDNIAEYRDKLMQGMKVIGWKNADLLDHCKRHFGINDLKDIPSMPKEQREKLLRDINELADLKLA